ncbi:6-phosphogluconate dehydrogenase C-terminal domain-like protein [Aspergillus homomorphus CBS 101889]|uniref:6-phosphogluconate dehydrogenase C-terminal domain-like protein n=1 Tax=Aspergillus homomorphus (strain CBS 101889) TaxID=1450537 RepID=A0A395I968_ASPHC|nr:6-phosphogluconate dehydrogenase C-terminal domain-like protein [Aspergillus homomorphus CBS 101889]RAL16772.1 6-phosphogluconate dehydrogenase C-terminal domain-like protein [Aspergillus homomorphus CBS 101889]
MDSEAIGILSIGEMGFGIAQLLRAHQYRVLTYASDRSESTQRRAWTAGIELRHSLQDLIDNSDVLLSIVPPVEALPTAERIIAAATARHFVRDAPLHIVDLNAVSPTTAHELARLYTNAGPHLRILSGGIIGAPPRLLSLPDQEQEQNQQQQENQQEDQEGKKGNERWHRPALVVSGPEPLPDAQLATVLNLRHVSQEIGRAAALKMCFAALTKGFTALAIESYTTADGFGVLPDLRALLHEYNPAALGMAERGVVGMPSRAYRWVHEMREIGRTMAEGGFNADVFNGIADVYQAVAEDPVLGREKPDERLRGQTVEDVVECLQQSLKVKTE